MGRPKPMTEIGKLNNTIYDQGPATLRQLEDITGKDKHYLKGRLRELKDLGKVEILETEEYGKVYHKEFNEIESVILDMVGE